MKEDRGGGHKVESGSVLFWKIERGDWVCRCRSGASFEGVGGRKW